MIYNNDSHTFAICAYQNSPYLEDCVRSLRCQEIPTKIIVVTSTPSEYIEDICRRNRLRLFVNTGKTSLADDWNYAVSRVKTPLVTLAHQDDIYERNYTKLILERSNHARHPLLLFTDSYEIRGGKRSYYNKNLIIKRVLLSPLRSPLFGSSIWVRRRILSLGNSICCPSVTFVKKNIGQPFFEDRFKSNIDWQAWETISRSKGEFIYINRKLTGHRIHESSTTTKIINSKIRTNEDRLMFELFWPKRIALLITKLYRLAEKGNK